jgi:aspartyl-tRNA synthetase
MSDQPSCYLDGLTESVTMVSCCLLICGIIMALPNAWQIVQMPVFGQVEDTRVESVVRIKGTVVKRVDDTINRNLPTGEIEVRIEQFEVLSHADVLPLQVNSDEDAGEETRLRYRYLDLRRQRPHQNILLRAQIIQSIRRRMVDQGFMEFQTPILTASFP